MPAETTQTTDGLTWLVGFTAWQRALYGKSLDCLSLAYSYRENGHLSRRYSPGVAGIKIGEGLGKQNPVGINRTASSVLGACGEARNEEHTQDIAR